MCEKKFKTRTCPSQAKNQPGGLPINSVHTNIYVGFNSIDIRHAKPTNTDSLDHSNHS